MAPNGTPVKQHFKWRQSDGSFLATTFSFNFNVCEIRGAEQQRKCLCCSEPKTSWEYALPWDMKFAIF